MKSTGKVILSKKLDDLLLLVDGLKSWHVEKGTRPEIIAFLCWSLVRDFLEEYGGNKRIKTDLNWLDSIMSETFSPSLKKDLKNLGIGAVINGLVHFQCTRHQAVRAVAEWLSCSETKVKTADKQYRAHKSSKFKWNTRCLIIPIILNSKKSFPKHYQKAYPAFQKILNVLNITEE